MPTSGALTRRLSHDTTAMAAQQTLVSFPAAAPGERRGMAGDPGRGEDEGVRFCELRRCPGVGSIVLMDADRRRQLAELQRETIARGDEPPVILRSVREPVERRSRLL